MVKCKSGFKMKDGKCVKKGWFSSGRKSYNPFKMWGSYVGMVLYPSIIFLIFWITEQSSNPTNDNIFRIFIGFPVAFLYNNIVKCSGSLECLQYLPYAILITLVLGFLIGYGIHSLLRRFSK